MYTPTQTAKLNNVDAKAWLADVLARLPEHSARKVADLHPGDWKAA
ncbi:MULTISPECIES: transposase domain-containing protein [unclassified Bradyrhizobium]|nr:MULTISPECIES: transposase domain-containing protein [unclassified Bradyrhizobium]